MPRPLPTRRGSLLTSSSSTDDFVVVGRVVKPHGLAGLVVVAEETDNPDRFASGSRLVTGARDVIVVERSRRTVGGLLVKFAGVDDRAAAEHLRGVELLVPASARRPLGPDEFWADELAGFDVRDPDGRRVGQVVGVVEGVGQDRLVVSVEGRRAEIPFVAALVPEVSRDGRFVVVVRLAGLLD